MKLLYVLVRPVLEFIIGVASLVAMLVIAENAHAWAIVDLG